MSGAALLRWRCAEIAFGALDSSGALLFWKGCRSIRFCVLGKVRIELRDRFFARKNAECLGCREIVSLRAI